MKSYFLLVSIYKKNGNSRFIQMYKGIIFSWQGSYTPRCDQSFVRGLILPFVEFWRLWRFERAIKLQFGFATFHCPTTDSRFRKNTRRPSPPRRSNLIEFSPRNVTRDKTINKTIKVTDSNPIVGSIANYRITGDFWEKVLREGNLTKRI